MAKKTPQQQRTIHEQKVRTEVSTGSDKEYQVTPQLFMEYLKRINPDAVCSFCGGDFGVAADPTGKIAPIVATPVPHVKGLGIWLYTASCVNCGHSIFFNAPFVASQVLEK